jgi:hypothetical protein
MSDTRVATGVSQSLLTDFYILVVRGLIRQTAGPVRRLAHRHLTVGFRAPPSVGCGGRETVVLRGVGARAHFIRCHVLQLAQRRGGTVCLPSSTVLRMCSAATGARRTHAVAQPQLSP